MSVCARVRVLDTSSPELTRRCVVVANECSSVGKRQSVSACFVCGGR